MIIYVLIWMYVCKCRLMFIHVHLILYLSDCVCFMDFDIWTADGDLIVLVYIACSVCRLACW